MAIPRNIEKAVIQGQAGNLTGTLQAYVERMPFAVGFGFKVVEARRGFVHVTLEPKRELFNHFGTYQAGVLCTLAEITGGLLCGTFFDLHRDFMITKKTEISFEHATARSLSAEASLAEENMVKALQDLERKRKIDLETVILIKNEAHQTIAQAHGLYYLRLGMPSRLRVTKG